MTTATSTTTKLTANWINILFFLGLHIGAVLAFLPVFFSWKALGLTFFLYWLTCGIGIGFGFHRLVSHRSFQTPKWLEYFAVFCGTLACQGGPIDWIGLHRIHHLYSDKDMDPHDSNKGFWWSHVLWMFYKSPADPLVPRFVKDIADDKFYQFLQKNFILVQVALGLLLLLLGGWSFLFWGVFFRLVFVFHCTWFVNSATHKFGYRTFKDTGDRSTNCWWVALLVFGEGWHNNHHAHQYSARHGLEWWEIDMTWMTIQLLQILGLVSNVKLAEKKS